ncbi:4 TMS phage holin, superfamily IV [Thermoactinomyces sp. DSM 45891]|uniref:phage holin family protein n=1 Tax=Thermoactinomyces sp. DSM 45891 TaxID=1761907 RepID=UPI0009244D46|nr:phage holin family protein [Thermoactinomyces sp. DSM 45891]SFX69460.1 4 TMS phage holin, superfamily IV [Thermoactinomyces sp. DSM 45891]
MIRHIVRFIVSVIVLMIVAALVPGFRISGFGTAIIAALFIALLGWLMEMLFGERISPYGRGIVGFISTVVVLYITSMIVNGFEIGVFSAIVAALVIGIVDLFSPTIKDRVGS